MTTLELFQKHRKGEVSRERFLYEVRRDNNLPWVTNNTSYDDAVKILKNKGIIRESSLRELSPQTKYNAAVKAGQNISTAREKGNDADFQKTLSQHNKFASHIDPTIKNSVEKFAESLGLQVSINKRMHGDNYDSAVTIKMGKDLSVPEIKVLITKDGNSIDGTLPDLASQRRLGNIIKQIQQKELNVKTFPQNALEESYSNVPVDPAADHVNPYFLKRGVNKILDTEKELTNDSYVNALNKAAKQLKANPHAFDKEMFGNAEEVAKADSKLETKDVKKGNHIDKDNGMKKMKGQETLKAQSAPTKENRKGKPKGVKVMPDKGVEGSPKIIKEISEFIKKKLAENSLYHEYHVGMEVETPHGPGIIKKINGGTLTVECGDGMYDVQMNTVKHFMEKKKEEAEMPQEEIKETETSSIQEASSVDSIIDALEEAQEYLRDGVDALQQARKMMMSSEDSQLQNIAERIKYYMLGHIEPLIDSEHEWATNDESIQDIIDDIQQGGEEDENEEDLYEADDNNSGFQNGDKIKIIDPEARHGLYVTTGTIRDIHDDGTAMVTLDDPKKTDITVDLSHVRKLRPDEMEEAKKFKIGSPGKEETEYVSDAGATDFTTKLRNAGVKFTVKNV